jgi:hypothetical protein
VLDLSGRAGFVSGRYSGTVVSTVKLHVQARESGGGFISGPPPRNGRGRLVRVVHVHAGYRITGLTGKLAATFAGLSPPLCPNLDDCGVTGTASWAVLSAGGGFSIDGYAAARPTDHGLRGALAALRRAGYFSAYGTLRHALGTTAAAVSRPDGGECHDTATVAARYLSANESRHGSVPLVLGGYESDRELLRTGCPGPPSADVLGSDTPASGRLRASLIARRRVELPLTGAGRFRDAAYSGAWRSRFTLGLRRTAVSVSYRLIRVAR